jgi:hypothetical protein
MVLDLTFFISSTSLKKWYKYVEQEYGRLEHELNAGNLAEIISRYPVRETSALDRIAKALEFQNRKQYERAVRKLLIDDQEALTFVKSLFGTLVSDLEAA